MRSHLHSTFAIALVSAALAACGDPTPPAPGELQRSTLTRSAAQSLTSNDSIQASTGNTAFALDVYDSVRHASANANAVYSPWSISSALAMTYAGASGTTATEMAHALHFTLPSDRLHAAFNAIDQSIVQDATHPSEGHAITWRSANALFAQTGKVFVPAFLDTLASQYGAGVSTLDFRTTPEPSRTAINTWVSGITEGHIAELLPAGSISVDTRLVLTNAVYFHAAWQYEFDAAHTHGAPFHRADGTDVTAQLMTSENNIRYATGDGFQAVEIPYANRSMTMLAILPTGSLDAFESTLNAARITEVTDRLVVTHVALSFPRFTMRSSLSLRDTLGSLGMVQAFTDAADLSGMDGTHELSIADVIHQAWIDVSESGTEAAAATAVTIGATSIEVSTPIVFDRPFVFLIRDNPSGAILFAGRVLDPTAH